MSVKTEKTHTRTPTRTPARTPTRTHDEWVAEARAHERRARWTDAKAAWAGAMAAATTKAARAAAAGAAAAAGVRGAATPAIVDDLAEVAAVAVEVAELGAPPEHPRMVRAGHRPGAVLRHVRRGQVLAECTYVSASDWRTGGVSYTSISAAANAAAGALGMGSKTLNGWLFWRVEKRET